MGVNRFSGSNAWAGQSAALARGDSASVVTERV
jgi:hypothetical protein